MPSSVCSFARFVSLPSSHSFSFSLSRSRPHLHTQRRTGSNGGSVRPPPAIVQPASQPASQSSDSSEPATTSVLRRHEEQKQETSHRLLPRRHRETNSYRGATRSSTILSHSLFPPAAALPERDSSLFLSPLRLPPSTTLLTSPLFPQPGPPQSGERTPVSSREPCVIVIYAFCNGD